MGLLVAAGRHKKKKKMAARGAGGGEGAEWCGTEIRFGMMQAAYSALYVFKTTGYSPSLRAIMKCGK
jgi:hypothetical protein